MTKEELKYHFGTKAPLNKRDNEKQTYGCRCYNPDICKYYGEATCAFFNDAHICTTPSLKWKKLYWELKNK